MEPIRIGIHASVIGRSALNEDPSKGDRYLRDTLGQFVEYVPVDPEGECALGSLGEAFRLEGDARNPRLVHRKTGEDFTERLTVWAHRRIKELAGENLCGLIVRGKSPISGMERVTVYEGSGVTSREGMGPFARIFMESFPLVPMEEDGRLHDAALRESFIDRIFVFKRWRETLAKGKRMGNLVDFHTRHKLLILAHSPQHHRMMGKLVAKGKDTPSNKLYADYFALLMEALKRKTTVKKNTNVLHHLMGYFKKQLSRDEKEELLQVIGLYHQGFVPLVVPTTLISHYVTKYDEPYLRQQVYLDPHPVELRLRNHV